MENNVVTLQTAKLLKAAGFPQEAAHWWARKRKINHLSTISLKFNDGLLLDNGEWLYAAPTAQEMADQLAQKFTFAESDGGFEGYLTITKQDGWCAAYAHDDGELVFHAANMAGALAALWLKLQEDK